MFFLNGMGTINAKKRRNPEKSATYILIALKRTLSIGAANSALAPCGLFHLRSGIKKAD